MDHIIDGIIAKLKQPQDFHIYNLSYHFYSQTEIMKTFCFQKYPSEENLKETVGRYLQNCSDKKILREIDVNIKNMLGKFIGNLSSYDDKKVYIRRLISIADKIQDKGYLTLEEVYDYYFCCGLNDSFARLSLTKLSITNIEFCL